MVKNKYPLPLIRDLIMRMSAATVYTKLDLRGAYNLVWICQEDEWKTAFRTCFGHFEYQVMPFGLCNATATFQHFMNMVFADIQDRYVVAYLDDILVFSTSLADHRHHVCDVLQSLLDRHLYVKLEKCSFKQSRVTFLGYVLSPDGVAMDPEKVRAVLTLPPPTNVKATQRFLDFANFYHHFNPRFSEYTAEITRLLRKGIRFA